MSLLREIQEGATNSNVPLADLLRKCKILAKRLKHEPLGVWAERELNGYPNAKELPAYRRGWGEVRATFVGPFQAMVKNVPIPSMSIDEKDRELLFTLNFSDGVAHFEGLLRSGEGNFQVSWPADYIALYSRNLMEGYHMVEAWRGVNRASIEGMLDQIRNRILSFALEISEENPGAGEAEPNDPPPVSPQKVDQIYNTYILGGSNVVASGNSNVIRDFNVVSGDWSSLTRALSQLGVPAEDIESLEEAIRQDEVEGASKPGPATERWLGKLTARVAAGSLSLANSAAGSAIASVVLNYLGAVHVA